MGPLKKLSNKHLNMIEFEITNPSVSQREIARQFNVSPGAMNTIYHSPLYIAEKEKRLKEVWKDAVKIAQKTMLDLAENGDRQAAQFILQTNNYAPEQSIDVNAGVIKLNITND